MSEQKIYAPLQIKEISTKYGVMLKVSFRADKLIEFAEANKNEKGYVNLDVCKKREVGKYGETHSAVLNVWPPRSESAPQPRAATPAPAAQPETDDNIPF